jgi:osmotically-inducible protein OsmY
MPADIGVETKNGVVYLSGKASNTEQIQHAVNVAKAISGVKRVESAITLSSNEK